MSHSTSEIIASWKEHFLRHNISKEKIDLYMDYISNLIDKGFPVIFELKHFSELVGVEYKELVKIVNSSKSYYRSFEINRKSGGKRKISSPYPILSICQKWIYENILKNVSFSEHAFAYAKGKTISDNADVHLGCNDILKVDVKDFFGSISGRRVKDIFKKIGYADNLSYFLSCICCLDESLPQGACTSPVLSNIFSIRLDNRLSSFGRALELNYSRYADDITFSGENIDKSILNFIEKVLNEDGLSLNEKKTVFKRKGEKKVITGVCITGNIKRATKNYRREFRRDYHYFKINGLKIRENGSELGVFHIDQLIGRANFILSLEPENDYVRNALIDLKNRLRR